MKTKTLENGTILEVGKKYIGNSWKDYEYMIIKYLADSFFVYELDRGTKHTQHTCDYDYAYNSWNLQPYQEPKKMVKVYKYAFLHHSGSWINSGCYYKNDDDFKRNLNSDKFIRLDYTEIEVEDYE